MFDNNGSDVHSWLLQEGPAAGSDGTTLLSLLL
jgi:hypothetical protein